jgi:hypothetical protein
LTDCALAVKEKERKKNAKNKAEYLGTINSSDI